MGDYRHISFQKRWEITVACAHKLGQCSALSTVFTRLPLLPEDRMQLLTVSLIKGAQATTAIEGNTLSEQEIAQLHEGWEVPKSKEYLAVEVKNILDAFNRLLHEVVAQKKSQLITPSLIMDFHEMVGRNLGIHFDAIPRRFREDSRVVGSYLPPKYQHVSELVEKLCDWIRKEFHHEKGQTLSDAFIQAIVTHVYIEWIHPFGDGNGRTGRLLEFYILLRAGVPGIASHVLSNFYNNTRSEYYRQLENARKKNDLSDFINYAVDGFYDGLMENLKTIQEKQIRVFWSNFIYDKFAGIQFTKRSAFTRKRDLILEFPLNREFSVDEIPLLTPLVARNYATLRKVTLLRDLKELVSLDLLVKNGRKYEANTDVLTTMLLSN